MNQKALSTSPTQAPSSHPDLLRGGAVEQAILRGRKMRSEAFWNLFAGLGRAVAGAFRGYGEYRRKRKAVAALRQMDVHMLADIGLTPSDVEFAATHGRYGRYASELATDAQVANTNAANDAGATTPREAA